MVKPQQLTREDTGFKLYLVITLFQVIWAGTAMKPTDLFSLLSCDHLWEVGQLRVF